MSLKVYRVSEKIAVMFLMHLRYAEVISQTRHDDISKNYRIKGNRVGVKSHAEWLQFAVDVMELNIRKFSTLDIEFPGAVCMGRMNNPTREECPICYEDVLENCLIARMECKHIFHEHCLLGWIKSDCANANTCPKCRRVLDDGRQITVSIYDKYEYEQIDKQ